MKKTIFEEKNIKIIECSSTLIENEESFVMYDIKNKNFLYSKEDDKIIENFFKDYKWEKNTVFFKRINEKWKKIFLKKAEENNYKQKLEHLCYYFFKKVKDIKKEEPTLEDLKPSDIKHIQKHHAINMKDEYILSCIKERPSSCVRDENGIPISWMLIYESLSFGFLHVLDNHRRKGLAQKIVRDVEKKFVKRNIGDTVYCHVITSNIASATLFEKKLGYKKREDLETFIAFEKIKS